MGVGIWVGIWVTVEVGLGEMVMVTVDLFIGMPVLQADNNMLKPMRKMARNLYRE